MSQYVKDRTMERLYRVVKFYLIYVSIATWRQEIMIDPYPMGDKINTGVETQVYEAKNWVGFLYNTIGLLFGILTFW